MRSQASMGVLSLVIALVATSCGGNAEDRLILRFQGISGDGIEQADFVAEVSGGPRGTSIDVDICQTLCVEGGEVTGEVFTQTRVFGELLNRGRSDIFLDAYTIEAINSGIEPITRSIGAIVPGGRCSDDVARSCSTSLDCVGGVCTHEETTVEFLLYDFDFKERVRLGQCPAPITDDEGFLVGIDPGSIVTQTLDVILTISGVDDTNERFTISTRIPSTFTDFDNCDLNIQR